MFHIPLNYQLRSLERIINSPRGFRVPRDLEPVLHLPRVHATGSYEYLDRVLLQGKGSILRLKLTSIPLQIHYCLDPIYEQRPKPPCQRPIVSVWLAW